ncbi:essential MCU regulator, mitochondrial [Drosophila miranda]|uniref:essential MCU regulator, mitochondrial n=1 Tax=Drosophila miranda TaxID=7229 RepID=UPI0007E767BE|nr:essential MCU regulator, mitochondrial [Drosophila miranda]
MMNFLKTEILQLLQRFQRPFRRRPKDVSKSYYKCGGLKPKPEQDPMSVVLILVNVVPGILLGTYAGKKLAYYLEVCELFMPDLLDEDD